MRKIESIETIEDNELSDTPEDSKAKFIDSIKSFKGNAENPKATDMSVGKFDESAGKFYNFYDEIKYDYSAVQSGIFITPGMMNKNPSRATKNLSDQMRYEIQKNAVDIKLSENKDYFKQFGCEFETPSSIVLWFSENKDYTLHETKVGTVQIVDYKTHCKTHHSGGVSQEKADIISADSDRSTDNKFDKS